MTTPLSAAAHPLEPNNAATKKGRVARRAAWALLVVLFIPGLRVGPVFDDWYHAIVAHTSSSWSARLFNLYDFFGAGDIEVGRQLGYLPWWADDGLSLRFFRPLSSLLLAIDQLLLDGGGLLSHVHAAVWFVVVVYAAQRLFRLMFSAADARWMTPLYGLLGCHAMPLAFAAARHSHATAAFAFAYLECVIRALAAPSGRVRWAARAFFALALLSGESAVTILPIAFAYVAVEAGARRALRAVAPELVMLAAFTLFYASAGYGAARSGAYLQPGSAAFFAALPGRWLALAGSLLSGAPADLWLMGGAEPLLAGMGVVSLVAAGLAARSVCRSVDSATARRLLALLGGGLLALVPLTGGIPGGRLVMIPSLGAAALFALAVRQAVRALPVARWRALLLGAWVALFGLALNLLIRFAPALEMARASRELPLTAQHIGEQCKGQVALGVGTPDPNLFYIPMLLASAPERPSAFHVVSMAHAPHELALRDDGTYELSVERDFLGLPWSRIYRDTPIPTGASQRVHGLDVEVLEAREGALRLSLRLTEAACWLTLDRGQIVPLALPRPAEPVRWTPTPRPM